MRGLEVLARDVEGDEREALARGLILVPVGEGDLAQLLAQGDRARVVRDGLLEPLDGALRHLVLDEKVGINQRRLDALLKTLRLLAVAHPPRRSGLQSLSQSKGASASEFVWRACCGAARLVNRAPRAGDRDDPARAGHDIVRDPRRPGRMPHGGERATHAAAPENFIPRLNSPPLNSPFLSSA